MAKEGLHPSIEALIEELDCQMAWLQRSGSVSQSCAAFVFL